MRGKPSAIPHRIGLSANSAVHPSRTVGPKQIPHGGVTKALSTIISGHCIFRRCFLAGVLLVLLPHMAAAQNAGVRPRIAAPIDENNLTVLRGNTYPLARAKRPGSRGRQPADEPDAA